MAEDIDTLRERMKSALATLNERERVILDFSFGLTDGCARKTVEIAKQFSVSTATIARYRRSGLRKLRSGEAFAAEQGGVPLDGSADEKFLIASRDLLEVEKTLTPYLISHLKRYNCDLGRLNPYVFEHLVAEFFAAWGFSDVRLVGRDVSTAADVFAMKKDEHTGVEVRYFIETKRWRDKVGITVINSVLGALSGERDAHGWHIGMIVSLAGYTDTKRYSCLAHKGLVLRDGNNVVEWLLSYEPNRNGLWLPHPLRKMDSKTLKKT